MKNSAERKRFELEFLATAKIANDPTKKGQLATRKAFGMQSRYAIAAVHTRFDAVTWFVWDAETVDPVTDGPAVVRQCATFKEAAEGLFS